MSDSNQIQNMIKNLSNLNEFSDVILVAGKDNQKYPVHRVILAASSNYFKALLGPNFREGSEKLVTLEAIDGPTLKRVIDFIYTGNVTITKENVHDIIAAASSMELLILEKLCAAFWESTLTIVNCIDVLLNADEFHLKELASKAEQFICEHFVFVPLCEMQKIDAKNFRNLLAVDVINSDESFIFARLKLWINENQSKSDEGTLTDLLKLIRLRHIPTTYLIDYVEPVFQKWGIMDVLMIEYHERLLRNSNREVICTRRANDETLTVSETSGSSETQLLDDDDEELDDFLGETEEYDEEMEDEEDDSWDLT